MNLAFILDQLDSIKTYKDSSFAMMREAAFRGHHLFSMQQGDLVWRDGETVGFARALELTGRGRRNTSLVPAQASRRKCLCRNLTR